MAKQLDRDNLEQLRSLYEESVDSNGRTGIHYALIAFLNRLGLFPGSSREAQNKAYRIIIDEGKISSSGSGLSESDMRKYSDMADDF